MSDGLLFQYGCYDWGQGEAFELDLTRQFIAADRAETMSQLHLTLHFTPDDELRQLGSFDKWCWDRDTLTDFRREVLGSTALHLAANRTVQKRKLYWERV